MDCCKLGHLFDHAAWHARVRGEACRRRVCRQPALHQCLPERAADGLRVGEAGEPRPYVLAMEQRQRHLVKVRSEGLRGEGLKGLRSREVRG